MNDHSFRFIKESNAIEGIDRLPTKEEIQEHKRFINLSIITVEELKQFVSVYQPNATIRDKPNLNVTVGNHTPPRGGKNILLDLQYQLDNVEINTPYKIHVDYETLHPFTDGNGRSGRALWAWTMFESYGVLPDRFLQTFYYQALDASRIL